MTKHGKCCRKFISRVYQKADAAAVAHYIDVSAAAAATTTTATIAAATITVRRCQRCQKHRIFNENYVERLLTINSGNNNTTSAQSQSSFSFDLMQEIIVAVDSDDYDDYDDDENDNNVHGQYSMVNINDDPVTTTKTTTTTKIGNKPAHCLIFNYLTHKYDSEKTSAAATPSNAAVTAKTTPATSSQIHATSCRTEIVVKAASETKAVIAITTPTAMAMAMATTPATACNTNQSTNSIYDNATPTSIVIATTTTTTTTTTPFTNKSAARRVTDKQQQRNTKNIHCQQQKTDSSNILQHILLCLLLQYMLLCNMFRAFKCHGQQQQQQQRQLYCWQRRSSGGRRLQLLPAILQLLLIVQLTAIAPQLVGCSSSSNNVNGEAAAAVEFGAATAAATTTNLSNKTASSMAATQMKYQQQQQKQMEAATDNFVKGGTSNVRHGLALAIGVYVEEDVTLTTKKTTTTKLNDSSSSMRNNTILTTAETNQHRLSTNSDIATTDSSSTSNKVFKSSSNTAAAYHHDNHQHHQQHPQHQHHHQQHHYQNLTAAAANDDARTLQSTGGMHSSSSIINLINRDNVLQQHNFSGLSVNDSVHVSTEKVISSGHVAAGGSTSACPSCHMREKLKHDNLESIKLHILMRLQLSKLPNITEPISVPHNILEKFYKDYNASLGARGRGRGKPHNGRVKASRAEKHSRGSGGAGGGGGSNTFYKINQQQHNAEPLETIYDVNAAAMPHADTALDESNVESEVNSSNDSFDDVTYADDMPNDDPHVYHQLPHDNEQQENAHVEAAVAAEQKQQQTKSNDALLRINLAHIDDAHLSAKTDARYDDEDAAVADDDGDDDDADVGGNFDDYDDDDDDDDDNDNDFGFGHHHHHRFNDDDDNFDEEFYSRINRVYVFPITPRIRHNRKPELLNFKFDNQQHTTISRAIIHIYIRGRDWMRVHDPTRLELRHPDGTTEKRRELIIAIYRAVRRPNALNFTHTVKLVESHLKIPPGQGQWIQIEAKALSTHWMENRNATQGIVIKGQDPWMRPFIVTGDGGGSQNKPLTVHIEILTKEKRRRKRSTTLDCQESDHEVRCCRYPLKVNFTNFGWHFVVAPTSFDAYFCNGECNVGFLEHYTHTHIASLTTSATPCCSPTKMSPLSLLYFNDNQNLVLSTIPNMSVEKCSCS